MPYDWVEPAVFMTYGPHTIYHIYRHDQIQDLQRDNWYSLTMFGGDDDSHGHDGVFDVRELPFQSDAAGDEAHQDIIRQALDAEYFDNWETPAGPYKELVASRIEALALADQNAFGVEVEQSTTTPEIDDVYLVHATEKMLLLQLNTRSKYPEVLGYNSQQLVFAGNNRIRFHNLPFDPAEILFMPGRYCLHVVLYAYSLLEDLSFRNDDQHLFERQRE